MPSTPKPDVAEIEKGLELFVSQGIWHELRGLGVPNGYRPVTTSGWFSTPSAMAKEAARLDQLGGNCSATINPTRPSTRTC